MKHIAKPTKTQKLHAIVNACIDVQIGHRPASKTIDCIREVIANKRYITQRSEALGDYHIPVY